MRVFEMINGLDGNMNVRIVCITLNSEINEWNDRILRIMMKRFNNVYAIILVDENDYVDDKTHDVIKQWVVQQPIIVFKLWFYSECQLCNSNNGLKLIKQYNQLVKQKQYLQELGYYHKMIGGYSYAKSKQKIGELIKMVDKV